MTKPRALDLYCGAGGASMGLRALIARALALEVRDPRTEALLAEMQRYLDSRPEEGDRANE